MERELPIGFAAANVLRSLHRPFKQAIAICADSVCVPAALWTAITLKLGTFHHIIADEWALYLSAAGVSIPIFAGLGLYRAVIRFLAPQAMLWILAGVSASGLGLLILSRFGVAPAITLSEVVIYAVIALMYVSGSRFAVRYVLRTQRARGSRVAIYGAGDAGTQLASALFASGAHRPLLFVDDNPALHGSVIHGITVVDPSTLGYWARKLGIQRVLLAMPGQGPKRRREILAMLRALELNVQTVPGISRLLAGSARVDDVGEVEVSDLLGRDPIAPDQKLLEGCIRGKCVMVTGAGGSIGSELCRQTLYLGPTRLVLFEMSEAALYRIERELHILASKSGLEVEIVPLLGNAHHKHRVREICSTFGIQTVYHAAAYKHVPIVEENMIEGLYNNVFATWHAAEAALEGKVETFVLISTDKAVNPTNVMGATKRLAEIVLQGIQRRSKSTRFCMVRFGNVLESSGSVVPLFRDQIRRGGPVTVTHPDVIRYFMTIPEAAQLVLQAGSMGQGGDVFVLDMGEPIRIVELARRMVHLFGLIVKDADQPDGDIEIQFTGLRPGEKLFEELLIGSDVTGTEHPMILRAVEHAIPWESVVAILEEMSLLMRRFDCSAARQLLLQAVREYRPSGGIKDIVWSRSAPQRGTDVAPEETETKVTELHARRPRSPGAATREQQPS